MIATVAARRNAFAITTTVDPDGGRIWNAPNRILFRPFTSVPKICAAFSQGEVSIFNTRYTAGLILEASRWLLAGGDIPQNSI